ncbi:hypothetical protein RvVAT039_04490 [Agrobacterium vitis]|uniref:DUF465 domain-containing protein n=1 Tax=Agrobacterium vitis TaxID=373 RepID=A0ABD6H9E1_AGRVI|nr:MULTISPECIES: hypothetical protein [Rhizobium/Agrobacterium group]MCF1446647.1 hypothetical protein [Allorhizobium ampelinum]MCF1492478.1 hypothetical protein [Allorhizobium ampelinum]MUO30020.1 hypothetical protein [Agrobacterium vitis]MUO42384.1 hypothetical protein [Agrobacterium vitis]MUP10702.1 hypothetical protein [Agrobacterium vitis]
MTPVLPLFLKGDLKRLQDRREALVRRIETMRPHERGKFEKLGELKAVTREILILEQQLEVRRG